MIIVVPYMAIIVWIDRRRSAGIVKQTYVVTYDSTCTIYADDIAQSAAANNVR